MQLSSSGDTASRFHFPTTVARPAPSEDVNAHRIPVRWERSVAEDTCSGVLLTDGSLAAWPASYEQQVLSFLTFTLKPYLEEWEDKIPATLLSGDDRQTVFTEHNVEGLLRTDSAGRAEFLSKMVANGLMTRNEGRKKENLPPKDGADELTVQVNMTNLEDLPLVNQGTANVEPTPEPAASV